MNRSRPLTHLVWLAALLVAGLALKAALTSRFVPRPWLFLDEMFYLVAAYDFGHWGNPGVPHPDIFYYPPLTSALLAPLHGFLPPDQIHAAGLVLFHVLLTSTVAAGWLLLRRLFGVTSRLLPLLLLIGPPAYTALLLMSEPVFIALYVWYLYFWLRMVQDGKPRDGWIAGLCLASLVLTRFAGYLVAASLVLSTAANMAAGDRKSLRLALRSLAPALIPPIVAALAWRSVRAGFGPESHSMAITLAVAVSNIADLALGSARKLVAQVGYVSLSTFGFALPAALWAFRERGRDVRLFSSNVLAFLALACALSAPFMWFGQIRLSLPRYDVYGRYVEYFALPLLVVALGVLARQRSPRERLALAAGALVLNALLLLAIPESFYTESLKGQIAPNSLGMAWILRMTGRFGPEACWLLPGMAALLTWVLSSRGAIRHAAGVALLLLASLNFAFALREVSFNSQGSARYLSVFSDYVADHPQAFAGGLYVDYPEYQRDRGPETAEHAQVYRLISDHVDKLVVGREPERYLGRMPVLTRKTFDQPVLAEWPGVLSYRIYAPH